MSLDIELRTYYVNHASVRPIIGERMYPLNRPEGAAYPHIIYQQVGGPREGSHDGDSNLAHPRIQMTCCALAAKDARMLADVVIAAAPGFRGTHGDVIVGKCLAANDGIEDYQALTKEYRLIVDLMISYKAI